MIAVDDVIFTIDEGELKVLLIQTKKASLTGKWAVPGGMVHPNESVDAAAVRHLYDKTGVKGVYLEQLYTFGRVDRDPFGRVVSVSYFALLPSVRVELKTTERYSGIDWFSVGKLPSLAYDHSEIISLAVKRLRAKLEYTNIVYSLLPKEFTLTELQKTYEIILKKKLDKRNFRKKFFSLGLVKKTNKREEGARNRPAELYRFTKTKPAIMEIL